VEKNGGCKGGKKALRDDKKKTTFAKGPQKMVPRGWGRIEGPKGRGAKKKKRWHKNAGELTGARNKEKRVKAGGAGGKKRGTRGRSIPGLKWGRTET